MRASKLIESNPVKEKEILLGLNRLIGLDEMGTDKVYLSLGSSSKSKTISKLFLSITALKGIEIESLFINLMYSVLILSKGMLLNILNFSSNSKLVKFIFFGKGCFG